MWRGIAGALTVLVIFHPKEAVSTQIRTGPFERRRIADRAFLNLPTVKADKIKDLQMFRRNAS